METSTPISSRREPQLMGLEDDSPIGDNSDASGMSVLSEEVIPVSKNKAGISNELDSMAVTPPKELSPDTMGLKLALHTVDIVKSSVNNHLVAELWEEEEHILDLGENAFAKKEVGQNSCSKIKWPAGMNDMNKVDCREDGGERSVDMDGMNKVVNEEEEIGRSVGMDGMNKEKERGGAVMGSLTDSKASIEGGTRKKKIARRGWTDSDKKTPTLSKLVLGSKAEKDILNSRACPDIQSPKRPTSTPMEIDQHTPLKKRVKKGGKKIPLATPSNQPLLTEVWKKKEDKER